MTVPLFPPSSRYAGIETARVKLPDGREVLFLRRRLLPNPDDLTVIGEHAVTQGERPDHVAAQVLGDPELFWRLCDGNPALRPEELTATVGRRLRVTLPGPDPAVEPESLATALTKRLGIAPIQPGVPGA